MANDCRFRTFLRRLVLYLQNSGAVFPCFFARRYAPEVVGAVLRQLTGTAFANDNRNLLRLGEGIGVGAQSTLGEGVLHDIFAYQKYE